MDTITEWTIATVTHHIEPCIYYLMAPHSKVISWLIDWIIQQAPRQDIIFHFLSIVTIITGIRWLLFL